MYAFGGIQCTLEGLFLNLKTLPWNSCSPAAFQIPNSKERFLFSIVEMKRVLFCTSLQSCPFVIVLCSFLGVKIFKKKQEWNSAQVKSLELNNR